MRNKILSLIITGSVAIFTLAACSSNQQTTIEPTVVEQHADWPRYDISQLTNGKSDLAVLVHVDAVEKQKDKDPRNPDAEYQIASLKVEDIYYGTPTADTIKLYQSVDMVKKNKEYILFLTYNAESGFYAVADGNSQIEVKENKADVKIQGIEGQYTKESFKDKIKEKVKK